MLSSQTCCPVPDRKIPECPLSRRRRVGRPGAVREEPGEMLGSRRLGGTLPLHPKVTALYLPSHPSLLGTVNLQPPEPMATCPPPLGPSPLVLLSAALQSPPACTHGPEFWPGCCWAACPGEGGYSAPVLLPPM